MAQRNFDSIQRIIPNEDGSYAFYDGEGDKRVVLPVAALMALLNKRERILNDLASENLERPEYWSSNDNVIIIFSMTTQPDQNSSRVLCIETASRVEVTLDRENADIMLIIIKTILHCQDEDLKSDDKIELTTKKLISIDLALNTFTLSDERHHRTVTLPLIVLASLWGQFASIQQELQNENNDEDITYWSDNDNHKIIRRRCRNSKKNAYYNALIFDEDGPHTSVAIIEETLVDMLKNCVGELPNGLADQSNETQMENNLTEDKNFQYPISGDFENFEIRNHRGKSLILPTTALDALIENFDEIMNFFLSDNQVGEREYWSNDSYYIATDNLENPCRNLNERVLSIIRKRDHYYFFNVKEETFGMMIEIYQERRRNRQ